jgi:hypothetical protein
LELAVNKPQTISKMDLHCVTNSGEGYPKVELEADATVVDYFNAYQRHIISSLANHQDILHANKEMKSKIESIYREKLLLQKTLEDRDKELEIATKKLLTAAINALEQIQRVEERLDTQSNIANLKYDIDVALSANRGLEKDLLLQKAENERLRNMNSQLARELKSCHQQYIR